MVVTRRGANSNETTTASSTQVRDDKKAMSKSVGASGTGEWLIFSTNPDKAWTEKFYLVYSGIWPLLFFGYAKSGWYLLVGDEVNMLVTCLIGLPNIVVPLLFAPATTQALPITERYWFKFELWIAIYVLTASYFFSEYFFDVLGMVYAFDHLKWTFDSILVGSGERSVPLMMYVHAWYFFITYHTCSVIFIRVLRTAPLLSKLPFIKTVSTMFAAWLFSW